jgi:peptide deformylase
MGCQYFEGPRCERGVLLAGKKIDPALLDLVKYPDPRLRKKSVAVTDFDDWLALVVRRMFEVMYASKGIGLAAPQVGLNLRLFVCNRTAKPCDDEELVFVNPVLSDLVGAAENEEGCLSLPAIYGPVLRAEKCRMQAFDAAGNPIDQHAEDLLARIWQHETDHLDGVLHIDRFGEAARLACRRALRELEDAFPVKPRKKSMAR